MSSVSKEETGRNGGKGGKTGLIVGIIVAVIVIAILIGVIVYLVVTKNKENELEPAMGVAGEMFEAPAQEERQEKRNTVVTKENVEDVVANMAAAEFTSPGYYTVTMNSEWHFPKGNEASTDAYVENIVENTNDVYFDLFLKEDEENAIYKSPVIPRGASLSEITLDTPLEAGSYDCILIYHLIDEDQNTLSTLRVTVTLIIEG
jgi:hypothetical protein